MDPIPRKPKHFRWPAVYGKVLTEHARNRLAGNPYAIRASSAAIAAIDAKLTEAYRAHVATTSGTDSIDPIAAYRELRTLTHTYQHRVDWNSDKTAVVRKLGAVESFTHKAEHELAMRADQFVASPGAAPPGGVAEASSGLPCSSRILVSSATPLPEGFYWKTAHQRLRAQRDHYQQSGNSLAAHVYNAALESIDQALREALRSSELTTDVSDPAAAYRKLQDEMNECRSPPSKWPQRTAISRRLNFIDRLTYEHNADLARCDGGFAALSEVPPPDSGPRSACPPRALEHWLWQQKKSAADSEERALGTGDVEAVRVAAAEKIYFNTVREEHLNGRDPWQVSRSFIRTAANPSGTTRVPHLEAAHGRLLEAMANPGLPERAATVHESTQESPSRPHARLASTRKRASQKCVPPRFRWEAVYSDLHMRQAQNQLAGNENATRACAEAIDAIDAKVMKAYRDHAPPFSDSQPIEPEAAYRAVRKAYDAAAKVQNKGYGYEIWHDIGAIDRLTHETSQKSALQTSECASVTPVEASVGTPRTSREFYPGSHPPGSIVVPRKVALPPFFDWTSAYRELNCRREQFRQGGNRLAARMVNMAIQAIDDRMRGIYDQHGSTRGAIQPEAAYGELLRKRQGSPSSPAAVQQQQSVSRSLGFLHRFTYHKTVEFARMDRGFAMLCMPAAPGGPGPVCNPGALARWLCNEAALACENEARARGVGNHAAAQAAWKEHIYFNRLREELDRGRDPRAASRELLKSLAEPCQGPLPPQLTEAHGRLLRAMSDSAMQMARECPGGAVRPPLSASLPTSQAAPPAGMPAGEVPGVSTASRPPRPT